MFKVVRTREFEVAYLFNLFCIIQMVRAWYVLKSRSYFKKQFPWKLRQTGKGTFYILNLSMFHNFLNNLVYQILNIYLT